MDIYSTNETKRFTLKKIRKKKDDKVHKRGMNALGKEESIVRKRNSIYLESYSLYENCLCNSAMITRLLTEFKGT